MAPLTEKQRRVYEFLQSRSGAIPPTVREICAAVGIKSTSTVHGILTALEEKGCISRDALHSRSIQLEGAAPATQVPVLGRVGLDPSLREGADQGVPLVVSDPDSPTAMALKGVARALVRKPRGLGGMKLPLSVA